MTLYDAVKKETGCTRIFYVPATAFGTEGLDGQFPGVTYITRCREIAELRAAGKDRVVHGDFLEMAFPGSSVVVLPRIFDDWNDHRETDYLRRALHTLYTVLDHGAKAVLFLDCDKDCSRTGLPAEKLWALKTDLRDGMDICEIRQDGSMHLLVYEI